MTDKKITNPGIYAVSVKWTSEQQVGAKQTPAIKLLLVSEEHGKIYATIWNSMRSRYVCQMNDKQELDSRGLLCAYLLLGYPLHADSVYSGVGYFFCFLAHCSSQGFISALRTG